MKRLSSSLLVIVTGAGLLGLIGGCSATAVEENDAHVSSADSALTAAQCEYFGVEGKVRICHKTGSTKKPYTSIEISEQACIDDHSQHAGDYVAVDDPTCQGGVCLPAGSPWDPTLPCCENLVVQNGVCTDLCAGVVCTASDQCHVAGTCDPATGQCSNPTADDGTSCSGGFCDAGVCRAPVLDFQSHQDFPTGTRPFGVAVGDVNNDGKPDVAFTLITSALVSVQLGNGDGTFGAASTFAVGSNSKFVEIADFNGDGNADLAVGGGTGPTHYVSILLGNGDGTFQGRADYNVNSFDPSGVAVADFNGDGKLDIATANFVGNTVSILLGNGDGTFQTAVPHAMPGTPSSVAAADLNGDGKLDLVTGNYNGRSVGVLLGNGDGTFQPAVTTSLGGRFVQVAAVGDLNGDGKPDVAASLFNDKLVGVLLGNGDGTLQSAINYPVANGAGDLEIADFNGDGRADVAGTLYSSNAVGVLLGNGDGTLQAAINFAVGTGPFYMAVGDLNGDGKRDIVTANYTGGSSSVLLNASH
ncbi:FG-GAP repeat domain-containing protein [Cystobacter fuscus]|uniref:FG-GAP repeat domain-containing protein n=1 Tax=Cystobacter fuscus TaxID=43 RepID=UPI002B2FE829|nr:VCBS repeat-containing protein [Cystobacter fuscus]